jgi:hypothetical protein
LASCPSTLERRPCIRTCILAITSDAGSVSIGPTKRVEQRIALPAYSRHGRRSGGPKIPLIGARTRKIELVGSRWRTSAIPRFAGSSR